MAKTKQDELWARYIDEARDSGQDELRKLYIKLRESGANPEDVQNQSFELDGGYEYNPFVGRLTGDGYEYDSKSNTTKFNDRTYRGYFDANILSGLNESNVNVGMGNADSWLKDAESHYDRWLDSKYAKELGRYGGDQNTSIDIDSGGFDKKYGVNKAVTELYDEHAQRALESAYLDAYNSKNHSNISSISQILDKGAFGELLKEDWTSRLAPTKEDKQQTAYNDEVAAIRKQYSNANTQKIMIDAVDAKYGKPFQAAGLYQGPQENQQANGMVFKNGEWAKDPIQDAQKIEGKPRADLGGLTLEEYSKKRDEWLEAGNSGDFKATLGQPQQPSTPTMAAQPSTPAPISQPSTPQQPDWTGLYDEITGLVDSYKKQLGAPKAPKQQIGSFQQYGPSATFQKPTSYRSSTQYSAKGS